MSAEKILYPYSLHITCQEISTTTHPLTNMLDDTRRFSPLQLTLCFKFIFLNYFFKLLLNFVVLTFTLRSSPSFDISLGLIGKENLIVLYTFIKYSSMYIELPFCSSF